MNRISFMLANYYARPAGYDVSDWGQGSRATIEYFKPVETFGERFDEYLRDVRALGFEAIDMWTDIIGVPTISEAHAAAAEEALRRHGLTVCSYGGWLGSNHEQFAALCEVAARFGVQILGGNTSMLEKDRGFVVDTLKKHGMKLGIENHPETVEQILEKIGDGGDGTIGTTVDTGWYGTQGVDAAEAIKRLAPHVFLVHLKDVREAGKHDTCRYGEGVVPIERCVRVLQDMGYIGSISVEHEPEHSDPSEDIKANLEMLVRLQKTEVRSQL
jgi:L-ribulose-5-phosphate 3-epimerase